MAEGKDPVKLFPDADGRSPAGTGSTDTPTSPSGNGRKGDSGPSERCGGTAVIGSASERARPPASPAGGLAVKSIRINRPF